MDSIEVIARVIEDIKSDFGKRVKPEIGSPIVSHGEKQFRKGENWTYKEAVDFAEHLASAVRLYSDSNFNGQYKSKINAAVMQYAKTSGGYPYISEGKPACS